MEMTKASAKMDSDTSPRIEPIEHPQSIKMKLVYWYIEKKMGKVITPIKVIQSRMPETLSLSQKLVSIEENLSLSDELVFYIKSYVATLNGCSFCIDIAKANIGSETEVQRYEQLLNYESSEVFTDAEKAALRYVEQATTEMEVADEIFEDLRLHFSDKEIVEITWLNALENYYNLINRPLRIGSDNLCEI